MNRFQHQFVKYRAIEYSVGSVILISTPYLPYYSSILIYHFKESINLKFYEVIKNSFNAEMLTSETEIQSEK
jgi:hypothetical protein